MRRIVDNIGCVVVWTVALGAVGALLSILVVRGMFAKSEDAVRQDEHPVCEKRSCDFPPSFGKPSPPADQPEH